MAELKLGGDPDHERDRLDEARLETMLVAHALWLSSAGEEGLRCELSGANLSYGGFLLANLRQAKLAGAQLFHANLRECDLSEADLTSADLRGANLVNGVLVGARLAGACLDQAIMPGANF